ncbi:MAG: LPS export ABC transporter ATP-binding protein [Pelagibacteraceae bacterium]
MRKGFRIIKFKKDKPILHIKDVSKSFDGRPILKKINMELFPGEIVGLLGPNGSGKSTLYSTIIGEHSPDSGKILINNVNISEKPIHERAKAGIGYLSQQRSVFSMTVYDNLLGVCQLSIKGRSNQISMVEKLLDEFNLQHLRNLHSTVLSGGEVRRLMMARILINKPSVILLDEPMAALDPIVVQEIQKYILKIQSYGCSILVTDHQVRNLFDIVDRAYVLGEQSIIAKGTPSEILKSSKAIELYFGSSYNSSN